MKKRPNALDRALADIWRNLKAGTYQVEVTDGILPKPAFMEPAELKREGSTRIMLGDRKIWIWPVER